MHILAFLLIIDTALVAWFFYFLVYMGKKVRAPLIDADVFEDMKEFREQEGATYSSIIAAGLLLIKRERARRNGLQSSNP